MLNSEINFIESQKEILDETNHTESDIVEKASSKGVWNPTVIMVISIFSFLPGAIWFAVNYSRLNHIRKTQRMFLLFCTTMLFYFSTNFIPWISSSNEIVFGLGVVISFLFKRDQEKWYKTHIKLGGKKASLLIPLVLCLSSIAFLIWLLYIGGFFNTLYSFSIVSVRS